MIDFSRLFSRILHVFAGTGTKGFSQKPGIIGVQCGHVPARPDADLTACWKCGKDVICDPATRLWRPLNSGEETTRREVTRQLHDLFLNVSTAEFDRILYERLSNQEKAARPRAVEGMLGRWVIVNGAHEDLAWSGMRWVPHRHGIPTGLVQVMNFATREEAEAYADAREQGGEV